MNQQTQIPDKPTTETPPTEKRKSRLISWLPVIVLLATFSVGFVPMWFKSSRLNWELHRSQQELRRTQLQVTLTYAALDARRGEHESARQGSANFFTQLTAELDRGACSALPANARSELQPLLAQRDDLITLLARGDPASADRMANAVASFRKTLNPK
jgi:hypothetical protein